MRPGFSTIVPRPILGAGFIFSLLMILPILAFVLLIAAPAVSAQPPPYEEGGRYLALALPAKLPEHV